MKKFISPQSWFSISYPDAWIEAEDEEGSFLFYNPDRWDGNLRISAFKDRNPRYAEFCMKDEERNVKDAHRESIGQIPCVVSYEEFEENGTAYANHYYVTGRDNMSVTFTFTTRAGESDKMARDVVKSLYVYQENRLPRMEIIPLRIWEIHQIDEAFDWVMRSVKKILKKDFTGERKDLAGLQQLIDSGLYKKGQRETWEAMGIAFGTILTNEMDGMEWVTVVDSRKEYPALVFANTDFYLEPMVLISSMISRDIPVNLQDMFNDIKKQVEERL